MAKLKVDTAPDAEEWFAVWFHKNPAQLRDGGNGGQDGSERPALMRILDDETLLLLVRDECEGVATLEVPVADAAHMRPLLRPDRTELPAQAMLQHLRDYAQRVVCGAPRGATRAAQAELSIQIAPAESARRPDAPESPQLTQLYWQAALATETPETELRAKYGKMNPGLCGMQLRAAIKRAAK